MATVRNGVVDEERYAGLAVPEQQIDVEKLLRLIEYGLTSSGPGPKVFSLEYADRFGRLVRRHKLGDLIILTDDASQGFVAELHLNTSVIQRLDI